MARLIILVEGHTEEAFANQVLRPHLAARTVYAVASKVVTAGRRGRPVAQGGGRTYAAWKDDLTRWVKQERSAGTWFTTMLDLYGLARFVDGFPGYDAARGAIDPYERVIQLEQAFAADLGNLPRFLPHLQLHEFEALLFAEVTRLGEYYSEPEHASGIAALAEMAKQEEPERIDDGESTAPSKRIIAQVPRYDDDKVVAGPLVAETIGLTKLRQRCPHFGQWLSRLEALAQGEATP